MNTHTVVYIVLMRVNPQLKIVPDKFSSCFDNI